MASKIQLKDEPLTIILNEETQDDAIICLEMFLIKIQKRIDTLLSEIKEKIKQPSKYMPKQYNLKEMLNAKDMPSKIKLLHVS